MHKKKVGVIFLLVFLILFSFSAYGAAASSAMGSLVQAYDPFFNSWTYPGSTGSCSSTLYWHNRTSPNSFRTGHDLPNVGLPRATRKVYLRSGTQVDLYALCLEGDDSRVLPDGTIVEFNVYKANPFGSVFPMPIGTAAVNGGKAFITTHLNYLGNGAPFLNSEEDGEHEFYFVVRIPNSINRPSSGTGYNAALFIKDPTLPEENFRGTCGDHNTEYRCSGDVTTCEPVSGVQMPRRVCDEDYFCNIQARGRGLPAVVQCLEKREDGGLCTGNAGSAACLSGHCVAITSELYPSRNQNPFGGDRICVSNENSFGECGSGYQCGGTNSDRCVNPRGGEDQICRSDSYCGQLNNGNYACIYKKPNSASCRQGYECESNSCSGAGTCIVDTRTEGSGTGGTGITSVGGGGITTVGGTDTTSKTTTRESSASFKGIDTSTCKPEYYWHTLDNENSRAGSEGVQTFVQAGKKIRAYATCIRDRAGEIVPDGREVTFAVFEEDGLFGDDDMGSVSSVVDGTVAFVDVVVNYIGEENPFDKINEYRFDVKCEENRV